MRRRSKTPRRETAAARPRAHSQVRTGWRPGQAIKHRPRKSRALVTKIDRSGGSEGPAAKRRKGNEGQSLPVRGPGGRLPLCPQVPVPEKPKNWSRSKLKGKLIRRKYVAPTKKQPPLQVQPFETRTKRAWSDKRYIVNHGPYSEWEYLVRFFQQLTPDPADFVRRNMISGLCIQSRIKKARAKLCDGVKIADRRKHTPQVVRTDAPLLQLQEDDTFRRWVSRLVSEDFEKVCPKTQAFLVLFIRGGLQARDYKEAVATFAAPAEPEPPAAPEAGPERGRSRKRKHDRDDSAANSATR